MANTKSAEKMIRSSARKRAQNRPIRTGVRNAVVRARDVTGAAGHEGADALVQAAVRALDKAAHKGVIHPNNAARRKSRLMKRLNALQPES